MKPASQRKLQEKKDIYRGTTSISTSKHMRKKNHAERSRRQRYLSPLCSRKELDRQYIPDFRYNFQFFQHFSPFLPVLPSAIQTKLVLCLLFYMRCTSKVFLLLFLALQEFFLRAQTFFFLLRATTKSLKLQVCTAQCKQLLQKCIFALTNKRPSHDAISHGYLPKPGRILVHCKKASERMHTTTLSSPHIFEHINSPSENQYQVLILLSLQHTTLISGFLPLTGSVNSLQQQLPCFPVYLYCIEKWPWFP